MEATAPALTNNAIQNDNDHNCSVIKVIPKTIPVV